MPLLGPTHGVVTVDTIRDLLMISSPHTGMTEEL